MVEIRSTHLLFLLTYVEDMFDCGDISIETNTDLLYSIDKLNAILAARVALNKEGTE